MAAATVVFATLSAAACTTSGGERGPERPPTGATTTPLPRVAGAATYAGNGVSFSYPRRWRVLELSDSSAATGDQVWSRAFGIDGRNLVSVSAYRLGISITPTNIDARIEPIREQLDGLFAQAGGALAAGPTTERMGGLPAVSVTGTAKNPSGNTVHSRLILAFDGTTEYFVNCQYDETRRDAILSGCDRIVSTFTVTG